MKKSKWLFFLLIFFLTQVSFFSVKAQNGSKMEKWNNMTDEEKAAKKEEGKAMLENRWQTVTCKKVENRLQARYQKYQTNKTFHQQSYEKMITKVNAIIEKYKKQGFDTTKVESDLKILEEKIAKLVADHDALIQKMKETSAGVCSATKENLGQKIQEIQKYRIETIKEDVLAIRDFYSTVLRPDLVVLIQSVAKSSILPTVTPSVQAE